jgi:cyclic patellamide precursor peptide PatG
MEQTNVRGSSSGIDTATSAVATAVAPQHGSHSAEGSCPSCGTPAAVASPPTYVYALGGIEPRFPRLSIEKEFAQATATKDAKGLTDRQAMHAALSKPENRYLVRQLCWVLTIEGLETYILVPRDPADLQLLVDAVRPTPSPADLDAVIGIRGPLAPPELCNGLTVPMVAFDQIYSFDRDSLLKAIPAPKKNAGGQFSAAAAELFDRIMLMADNAGATDDHRAVNYLAVRYPAIYHAAADMFGRNASLTALEVRPSSLSGTRRIVDVIFTYTNRETDVAEKQFCRVDVTEEFPFLVTKLSPYYDRM